MFLRQIKRLWKDKCGANDDDDDDSKCNYCLHYYHHHDHNYYFAIKIWTTNFQKQ